MIDSYCFVLTLDYNIGNNNIVRNYFVDNQINGIQDSELDVWDRFFDIGDPNRQVQQVAINYDIPFNKIPTFNFVKTTYSYTGDYQWQKGSDLFGNLTLDGQTYDLGNSISNANTHNINSILDMQKFYRYLGLTKFTRGSDSKAVRGFSNANPKKNKSNTRAEIEGNVCLRETNRAHAGGSHPVPPSGSSGSGAYFIH